MAVIIFVTKDSTHAITSRSKLSPIIRKNYGKSSEVFIITPGHQVFPSTSKGIIMKSSNWRLIALLAFSSTAFAADQTYSGLASATAVQSGASAGHSIAASGKVTSAASAIPLAIGGLANGAAGAIPVQPAQGSSASAPLVMPLEITDETFTVMQPDEALKKFAPTQGNSGKGLLTTLLLATTPAHAGSGGSSSSSELHFPPEQIISFAKQVETTLATKDAHVAILARMGRPATELPEGMHFTHVAFAVYSQITTADGRKVPGYAVYNLYQDDKHPDTSTLVRDFPADFFAGVAVLEAGIIIPSIKLQKRLLDVINSPSYSALHDPHYSLIANPYTLGRQNCTEHTLDVIGAAMYRTSDIKRIKANEIAYFKAQPVNVNWFKLAFGSLFSAEISTSDQPDEPVTATFETISSFLQKYDKKSEVMTIMPDAEAK
jgi:hypothetical protein